MMVDWGTRAVALQNPKLDNDHLDLDRDPGVYNHEHALPFTVRFRFCPPSCM